MDTTVDRVAAPRNLCELFQRTAAAHADGVALRDAGGTVELTWSGYAARVRSIAAGLARPVFGAATLSRSCSPTGPSSTWSTWR